MNVEKKVIAILSDAKENGVIAKGYLEVVRSVQQRKAKIVIIAKDIDNKKLALEIRRLCNIHEMPFVITLRKKDLGKCVGLSIDTGFASIKISGFNKNDFFKLVQFVAKVKSQ